MALLQDAQGRSLLMSFNQRRRETLRSSRGLAAHNETSLITSSFAV